jgi:putative MATE family efflux protein
MWPLIIEQTLQVTMGMADTLMVSSVGEHAVSGVNAVDNINNLLIIAFTALATGGAVVVSQYIGRRDNNNSSLAARQLMYISLVVSVVMAAIGAIFAAPIIRLLYGNVDADVMASGKIYFVITALSYPLLAIYNAAAALFRSIGNSRVPMLIAVLVNIINIGGNAILIYGLGAGAEGAAISTLASRLIAAAVLLFMLIKNRRIPISLSGIQHVEVIPRMIHSILNVGLPSMIESSMFQVGRLLTQRIFTTFGTVALAGNSIASVINSFSNMPGNAYSIALLTIVGQCIGAGDYDMAKSWTKKVMFYCYITITILSGIVFFGMEPLIGLFNLSAPGHAYAREFLTIHCVTMMFFWAPSWCLPNALRASGDAKYVMTVAVVSMYVVRVLLAYFITFYLPCPEILADFLKGSGVSTSSSGMLLGWGPVGVWLAMGLDFIDRGAWYTVRWMRGKWQGKRVIVDK